MIQKIHHVSNIIARKILKLNTCWASHYWHHYPFGKKIKATKAQYISLWEKEKSKHYNKVDTLEAEMKYAIDKTWLDQLALHTQIVLKSSSLCYQHGRILYSTMSNYLCSQTNSSTQPITVFETGTARGFSSVVLAKALSDQKRCGKIITFDVLPHDIPMFWNCIDDHDHPKSRAQLLNLWNNLIEQYITFVEGDNQINLKKIKVPRIHFAFLDGSHKYRDVYFEFQTIAAYQEAGDIIIFDDYNVTQFPGLVNAVDEGCSYLKYRKRILSIGNERSYVIATKN